MHVQEHTLTLLQVLDGSGAVRRGTSPEASRPGAPEEGLAEQHQEEPYQEPTACGGEQGPGQ